MNVARKSLKLVHRAIGSILPPTAFARRYSEIPGAVHVNDLMLASEAPHHVRHYLDDGRSAIENLEQSLAAARLSWSDVGSCLDLPSGYGRVTRLLARRIDPGYVTACDVDANAVGFCMSEFAVNGIVADRDPSRAHLGRSYDLVFVGSLLTHLPEAAVVSLLDLLVGRLAPHGLLVFTTQGESCLDHLGWYGEPFARLEPQYRDAVRRTGTCFVPYPHRNDYGVAIHAQAYVTALLQRRFGDRLTLLRFADRGWDRHQDVWTYRAVRDARR
jgi:SAM-dependent methyltransferase